MNVNKHPNSPTSSGSSAVTCYNAFARKEIIGDCVLYLGDCLEIMPSLGKVDMVVSDPPYNFSTSSSGTKHDFWADIVNSSFWFRAVFGQYVKNLQGKGCIWTFTNWKTIAVLQKAFFDIGCKIDSLLVWDKEWIGPGGSLGLRPSYEMCAFTSVGGAAIKNRGLPDIWRHKWSSKKPHGHPAEKPESLLREIIEETPGELCLDAFMGSGTAGVAAVAAGKKYIGIELDEKWFDLSCKRIDMAYKNKPTLFDDLPVKKVQGQQQSILAL